MRTLVTLDLDPRPLSAAGADESELLLNLPQELPTTGSLTAHLSDGRVVPSQLLPQAGGAGQVALQLPAELGTGARVVLVADAAGGAGPRPVVVLSQDAENVSLWLGEERFALYRYNTADPERPRPYFHPIAGPHGAAVTQDGEFPGTQQGHIWHTGLVLAHQKFTDGNNWQTGGPQFSRMRHLGFTVMESGPLAGRFVERLEWLNTKGDRVVFTEQRTVTIPLRSRERRCLDIDTVITCGAQPAVWESTPYHLVAVRVPDGMLVGKGGTLTTSEGVVNPKDGEGAKWIDYSGPLPDAAHVGGMALFNHPQNPRHPTPCLNFLNQTIGLAPTHREPLSWQPGESRRFRFRALIHAGDVKAGKVAEEYQAWSAPAQARVTDVRKLPSRG